jgi:hypothetical protein
MAGVKVTLGCSECGRRFSYIHDNRDEPEDQFCPFCEAAESAGVGMDFSSNRAPIATSNTTRAVNEAYRQMEGAGFTDMKDGLREGDTAAPSLTKDQAQMAEAWDLAKKPTSLITPAMVGAQNMGAAGATNWLDVARAQTGADRQRGIGDPLVSVMKTLKSQGRHHHGTPIDSLPRARRR